MAAGDALLGLIDEDTPAPQFAPARSKQQALRQRESRDAYATAERTKREDEDKKARYGTTNREEILAREATGALVPDFAQRAQIDPQWAKAAAARLSGLVAHEQSNKDAGGEREFSAGTGAHGEPYFTNLSRDELKKEHHDRVDLQRSTGTPVESAPVTNLHRLSLGDEGEAGATGNGEGIGETDPAALLFSQRLDKVSSIAGAPGRRDKHAQVVEKIGEKLQDFKKFPSAEEALGALHGMRQSGRLGRMGVTLPEEQNLERAIVHFAKSNAAFDENPDLDRTMFRPWTRAGDKPGMRADKAEPATILNPGGSMPEEDMVEARKQKTMADHASALTEEEPKELPRTYQYATRRTPSPRPTPRRQRFF